MVIKKFNFNDLLYNNSLCNRINWSHFRFLIPDIQESCINKSKRLQARHQGTCLVLRTLLTIWVLLSALFFKVHQLPLLMLHILMEKLVHRVVIWNRKDEHSLKRLSIIMTYLCLSYGAFYQQGNSNSLSTIEVTTAFIGLNSYQPILGGIFMVIHIFSLYVYWILMMFIRYNEAMGYNKQRTRITGFNYALNGFGAPSSIGSSNNIKNEPNVHQSIINTLFIIRFSTTSFFMLISIYLRNHLFIWTVICPKFLYEAFFPLVLNFIILIVSLSNLID